MLFFFCNSIYKKAQILSLNPINWVLGTIVAFSTGILFSCFLLAMIFTYKYPKIRELILMKNSAAYNELIIKDFAQKSFLYSTLIMAGAFGGFLFIKYLLDKKQNKAT
jgi:hypothetical protein